MNFGYDKKNDFGTLAAAGDFPNVINLGEASAEKITVDIKMPGGAVTTDEGVTLALKGCNKAGGAYEKIVESGTVTQEMLLDGYGLPIPKNSFQYLKVAIAGDFNGKVQALINSYPGK